MLAHREMQQICTAAKHEAGFLAYLLPLRQKAVPWFTWMAVVLLRMCLAYMTIHAEGHVVMMFTIGIQRSV
jgi:hypothetical protein